MATYPFNQTTPKKGSDGYLWNWLGSPLKKFAQAIQPYISGGGGGGVTEVTYSALQTLISGGTLVPGVTYKITGFNENNPGPNLPFVLYDDGTNSGITIYMQAISTTEMATSGYGEFYNPKYTGFIEYNNTDGTGLFQIWDGNNPNSGDVPAYQVGDVVFWGGYAWENNSGNVGNAVTVAELNSDWDKLPYSDTTWYNQVLDEIKVDWDNGVVVERKNAANDITVTWTAEYWYYDGYNSEDINPIALIPWGNYGDVTNNDSYGVATSSVTDSYVELVNFKGQRALGNTIGSTCRVSNNYFGKFSRLQNNILTNNSDIINNTLTNGTDIEYNILTNNSDIINNTLTDDGYISYNTLTNNSYIYYNTLNNDSNISRNTLTNGSEIYTNTLTNSSEIYKNTLNVNSEIYNNTLDDSYISYNTLDNSYIYANTLDDSYIYKNTLTHNSILNGFASGTFTSKTIEHNTFRNADVSADISTATHIYAGYTKDIFTRQDGTVKLSYFDNSDALTVVAVNA